MNKKWLAISAIVLLASVPALAQIKLNKNDMVSSMQGVEAEAFNVAALRAELANAMRDPSRVDRMNREPLSEKLGALAQMTIAIQFDLNSARIRPESYKALALMADSLYHPYLMGYRFLVVGHTDARGNREYNLKLSQQRADAIRDALINPFGIDARRIEAIGLGEEQLFDRAHPEAGQNRRVQLINIGR